MWEIIDHTWLMYLPMATNHGLDALVTALIVAAISVLVFSILRRYEGAITRLNAELICANEALSRLEATRDERLLTLARDLSFGVAGLVGQAKIALQSTTGLPNIKALSDAIDRAQKLHAIAHELLELKELASNIPAVEVRGWVEVMRVLGVSDLGKRMQHAVRDDARFAEVLAVERDGSLLLYTPIRAKNDPVWRESYVEWARLVPADKDHYRLDHLALSGQWQELDVHPSLEGCVSAIMENKYHLFFL